MSSSYVGIVFEVGEKGMDFMRHCWHNCKHRLGQTMTGTQHNVASSGELQPWAGYPVYVEGAMFSVERTGYFTCVLM